MAPGNDLRTVTGQGNAHRRIEEILEIRDIAIGAFSLKNADAPRNTSAQMPHVDAGFNNTLETSREIIGGFVDVIKWP